MHRWKLVQVPRKPDPDAYRLAYDEGVRALDEQNRAVDELRLRAGTLLAAAAVATSFFGSETLKAGQRVPTVAWIAIGAFFLLGVALLAILWPRGQWWFSLSPRTIISEYLEAPEGDPTELDVIHRDLALHMDAGWRSNREQLRDLMTAFRVAVVLLVVEILAWALALAKPGII